MKRWQPRVLAHYGLIGALLPALAGAAAPPRHERFTCTTGPEVNQVRFIMEVAKEKPVFFALWTADRGYRCSVPSTRGDFYSKWIEGSGNTVINMIDDAGTVTIEGKRGHYKVQFQDINKMRYCGMEGELNAVLTLTRGKRDCHWEPRKP